jgi:cystathionine beta-lyase
MKDMKMEEMIEEKIEEIDQKENLDFDRVIDRRNTNSLKYDFALRTGKPEDVIPLWVADMDFPVSQKITEAIKKRVEHGIFGYSEPSGNGYFEALQNWMKEKHDWAIERKWLVKTPGVVFALAMAVKAYTEPGDAVLIQQPVYYPFRQVIEDNNRKMINNSLWLGDDGKYHMDLLDFEKKVQENQVKLFLLCNPHNPVGRVWTKQELAALGEICVRHGVIVVSDEIHEDFVFKGKHQVFAALSEELKNQTITCTAPSKTFNLAGLQTSNILIANTQLKHKFRKQIAAAGCDELNVFGLTACEAAYRDGDEWYQAIMKYLQGNIEFLKTYLQEKIPDIRMIGPEGTYLVWLDFRELKLTEEQREELVVHKARLWLDSGSMFGAAGEGFERINIACPRSVLEQALDQLERAVKEKCERIR